MKKQLIVWSVISVLVMLGLPFMAVLFAGDAGMMICFLLFYALNPIYSVIIGSVAGKAVKELWPLPVISAVLFIIGVWIFFTMSEVLFLIYALVYLALGMIAMLISKLIHKRAVERK